MEAFYTCRNDRAFKEVFLKPDNSDLLKALLEFILKIKIDKLEIKKTELLSGDRKSTRLNSSHPSSSRMPSSA